MSGNGKNRKLLCSLAPMDQERARSQICFARLIWFTSMLMRSSGYRDMTTWRRQELRKTAGKTA